jgi:hypothetical protein
VENVKRFPHDVRGLLLNLALGVPPKGGDVSINRNLSEHLTEGKTKPILFKGLGGGLNLPQN